MKFLTIFSITLVFSFTKVSAQSGFTLERMTKIYYSYKKEHIIGYNEPFAKVETSLENEFIKAKINDIAIILSPQMPNNFTKVVKNGDQEWQLSGELNFGLSYGLVIGQMYKESGQEHAPMKPYFGLSFHFSGGTTQDFEDNEGLTSNLNIGGSIIFLNYMNLFIGYDLLNKSTIVGLGARVDMVSYEGFGGAILNNKQIISRMILVQ